MTDTDAGDPYLSIHDRLVERDPTAPADLAEQVLEQLLSRLRRRFPELAHDTLLDDAVVDAVLSYAERPEQFDPMKAPLVAYLTMSARGDVLNALARRKKQTRREVSLQVVEESPSARKTLSEHGYLASADDVVIERFESDRVAQHLRAAARSSQDVVVLQLMVDGERRTERYAAVLGVDHLDDAEQRRIVKQAKDRLKKRLERIGAQLND